MEFKNWQLGLGGGDAHYDEIHHTAINPWVYYSSEKWDIYLHSEHYSRSNNPWWYKGYVQRKFDSIKIGLYKENGMGIGPSIAFGVTDHIGMKVIVSIWSKSEKEKTKFLINLVFSF